MQVRLDQFALRRPRPWGACWVGCCLWDQLKMDEFWHDRLPDSREGTCWRHVLETLTIYRLIDPGREWRLHRQWFHDRAMADLLEEDFSLAESKDRVNKERSMRRRQLKKLVQRLKELAQMELSRDQLLLKLGAAKSQDRAAWRLLAIQVPEETAGPAPAGFTFALLRDKLRQVRRRQGRYLLRGNLSAQEPEKAWQFYMQRTQVAEAFKDRKDDLSLRPIFHQLERRIEAHIFVSFLAYCLRVHLRACLRPLAPGLTPRSLLEKFAAIQMLDVHFPTSDGRELVFCRSTQPEKDHKMLLAQLGWERPPQSPPRITQKGQLLPE